MNAEICETFFGSNDEEYEKALKAIDDAERRKKLIYFRTLIYYVTGYDIASIDYFEPITKNERRKANVFN